MMNTTKVLLKQFFGAKYQSAGKSLLVAVILFIATYSAEIQLEIAPFILFLTSTFFTVGVMWQMLTGKWHIEAMQGMFMLPFDNRRFVFSYIIVMGANILVTKILPIWALFFAAASWHPWQIFIAVFCSCMACFLPLLFREFQTLNMFPIGLAILCMNTPICTLLSSDPDLEQSIRVLPGQAGHFYRRYCLFIFIVNGIVADIYLGSWQIIYGGIGLVHVETLFAFALQSAILSVILEWKYPIHGWKTESDLWHHPRKYIIQIVMLLMAALVVTYLPVLRIWIVVLLMECGVLFYRERKGSVFA